MENKGINDPKITNENVADRNRLQGARKEGQKMDPWATMSQYS